MSINIHHGPPGSYKSSGVIQRYAVPALLGQDKDYPSGRTVVTNVRGFDSIETIEKAYGVKCPESSKILNLETDTKEGLFTAARWFQWAPIGALIILDESQAVYPAKRKDFKLESLDYPGGSAQADIDQRPHDVLIAFDMHRHYNWDVFLCTPNIAKIHTEIRQSTQAAFRHWDMSPILPWKKGRWRELEHDSENSGKSASHCIGVPKEYKINKQVFDCYQSTKTGESKQAIGSDSILKDKKLRFFVVLIVISVSYFAYSAVKIIDREKERKAPVSLDIIEVSKNNVLPDHPSDNVGNDSGLHSDSSHTIKDHPLDHMKFYIVGTISSSYIFESTDGSSYYSFTDKDLYSYGYDVLPSRPCVAYLVYNGVDVQTIHCKPTEIHSFQHSSSLSDHKQFDKNIYN